MICWFCLEDRPGSEEHIFPLAIGGTIVTDRVCVDCNGALGSRVDAALCDNFLVRMRRAELCLAGNSGKIPAIHELLLGVASLSNDTGQRVETTWNARTKELEMRSLYSATTEFDADGSQHRRILIDVRDAGQIPKIIMRERRRHSLPPLTETELESQVRRFKTQVETITNPKLKYERSYSFAFVRHAMLKIAYELACLWLGDQYLSDPEAELLRAAIMSPDPRSTDHLPAAVHSPEANGSFRFWAGNPNLHLTMAHVSGPEIAIVVRVFDIHEAVVWVSRLSSEYLKGPNDNRVRFVAIDPVSKSTRDVTAMEEFERIALDIAQARGTTA